MATLGQDLEMVAKILGASFVVVASLMQLLLLLPALLALGSLAQQDIPRKRGAVRARSLTPSELRVGTVNLWNVMFNWQERAQFIADTIAGLELDVVGLEEVRTLPGNATQVDTIIAQAPQV